MPTVLRINGFQVVIFASRREHGPAHVHVFRHGEEVVISLGTPEEGVAIRNVRGMRRADLAAALRIVEAHADALRKKWEEYHG